MFIRNKIEFRVDKNGMLIRMVNKGPRCDVTIPNKLNGQEIKSLDSRFCSGAFGKVVVDDRIECVSSLAFADSDILSVVWPSSCSTIPADCFRSSSLTSIFNIDNVKVIGCGAFCYSQISHIDWPSKC